MVAQWILSGLKFFPVNVLIKEANLQNISLIAVIGNV